MNIRIWKNRYESERSTIAQNFKDWFNGKPLGIGSNTFKVLAIRDYVNNPQMVAECIWKLSNRNSAANGALMRTSVIGLWNDDTEKYATEVCKLTHYDPRCTGSFAIVSLLINNLVYNNQILPLEQLIKIGERHDSRIKEYLLQACHTKSLDDFILDGISMGYTLDTLAVAIWSLYHCSSFEEGLLAIVNAGGDADTNAAVGCSLLGAKYGYSTIPKKYIDGLTKKDKLSALSNQLASII